MSGKKFTFEGKDIDVEWDQGLCIHVGECVHAKGDLFDLDRQPWCDPDVTGSDYVVDVVERCPSGALTYIDKKGGSSEKAAAENTVSVTYDGPYFFRGNLQIDGVSNDMKGVRFRAALCRCGESKNKPFCDNSHREQEFRDQGAVGHAGPGHDGSAGPLKVEAAKNGPLLLSGNVAILAGSGRVAWKGTRTALCRCGQSKNKPFCDGTHAQVGFKAD